MMIWKRMGTDHRFSLTHFFWNLYSRRKQKLNDCIIVMLITSESFQFLTRSLSLITPGWSALTSSTPPWSSTTRCWPPGTSCSPRPRRSPTCAPPAGCWDPQACWRGKKLGFQCEVESGGCAWMRKNLCLKSWWSVVEVCPLCSGFSQYSSAGNNHSDIIDMEADNKRYSWIHFHNISHSHKE